MLRVGPGEQGSEIEPLGCVRMLAVAISGKPLRLGPGDVGYIGSNEIHNAKNVGSVRAQYFIVNVGRDDV